MAKKSGIVAATNRITALSGKGPYSAREIMNGSKCMSTSQGKLTSARGKMSSAHGVVPKNTSNNMTNNTGGYRIGAGTRTFRHGLLPQQGGGHGAGHKSQPQGHKKGFNT